ncbi:hypothetical protein M758_UG344000 [Ceratodon purpureus]|nr:hypothetical protein M758_UG344000 [Ceratodon purpureus]
MLERTCSMQFGSFDASRKDSRLKRQLNWSHGCFRSGCRRGWSDLRGLLTTPTTRVTSSSRLRSTILTVRAEVTPSKDEDDSDILKRTML